MKLVSDILVPLDGSTTSLKSLGVAIWLVSRLEARAHVLNAGEPLPVEEALKRLGVDKKYRALVEVHQVPEEAADAIVDGAQRYQAGLVIMTARGESAESEADDPSKIVGHVTRSVIERSSVPVLVLPPAYQESLPWHKALVPLSGEATDQSLTFALHLAHAAALRVAIAHVAVNGGEHDHGGRYADELHHEFAQALNQLIARACPMCTGEERARIETLHLQRGDIGRELLRLIQELDISVLVVGWHGEFMVGHAQVLKRLIGQVHCPVLLVKPSPPPEFRLKVGEAFE